jgi:hypothetical protein
MEQSNVFLQMEKKNQYLRMEQFKELKRMELRQLNMQAVKKIYCIRMALVLENIQMEELKKLMLMAPRKQVSNKIE